MGAGFGGLSAARALRHADVFVTVVDRSNHHLFQPLLYQVATGGLSPSNIATPIRAVLKHQENTQVLMAEVLSVDLKSRDVILADRRLPFEFLILATGSRTTYFGHEQWEKSAPGLKSISDATLIRKKILLAFERAELERDEKRRNELLTFVIVGGGPTGVELAGAIAELSHRTMAIDFRNFDPKKTRIVLLEAGPRILATFPVSLAERASRSLFDLGVEVKVTSRVERLDENGVVVGGEEIQACLLYTSPSPRD